MKFLNKYPLLVTRKIFHHYPIHLYLDHVNIHPNHPISLFRDSLPCCVNPKSGIMVEDQEPTTTVGLVREREIRFAFVLYRWQKQPRAVCMVHKSLLSHFRPPVPPTKSLISLHYQALHLSVPRRAYGLHCAVQCSFYMYKMLSMTYRIFKELHPGCTAGYTCLTCHAIMSPLCTLVNL